MRFWELLFNSDMNIINGEWQISAWIQSLPLLLVTCMILMLSWQTSSCVLGCWKTYEGFRLKKKVLILLSKQNVLLEILDVIAKTQNTTLGISTLTPKG